jgi:hypothetical protein
MSTQVIKISLKSEFDCSAKWPAAPGTECFEATDNGSAPMHECCLSRGHEGNHRCGFYNCETCS